MTTLEKQLWLINTLFDAGENGLSLKDLDDKWQANGLGCLPRQTFNRWKDDIQNSFGIVIECKVSNGYRYCIKDMDALRNGKINRWLLDAYSTSTILSHSLRLSNRILVDATPSGQAHLTTIIKAMENNNVIDLTYKNFWKPKASSFPVHPYYLRMVQRRWYMLAYCPYWNEERIFALDRIATVSVSKEVFKPDSNFDAEDYFSTFFGAVLDKNVEVERIRLRAYEDHIPYMRTLPLHHSQVELPKDANDDGDYADFELTLRPTYDFRMELLKYGSFIEVLEPQSLRNEMLKHSRELYDLYKED